MFIFDVNGVLDTHPMFQTEACRQLGLTDLEINHFLVALERNYEEAKSAGLEEHIRLSLPEKHRHLQNKLAEHFRQQNHINSSAQSLMERISKKGIPIAIYSSLSSTEWERLQRESTKDIQYKFWGRDMLPEAKPSMTNLLTICAYAKVEPSTAVMVGDNIISDLFPAKLLGMRTILISPWVDQFFSSLEADDITL